MTKYRVTIPYAVFVSVEVEANDVDEAEALAFEEGYLTGYCGNGGTDKLVGVGGSNVSVEVGDYPIDTGGFEIEIDEIA